VFDDDDRLAGEKTYYDRATVLRQLGIFLEPDRGLGRIATIIMRTERGLVGGPLVKTLSV